MSGSVKENSSWWLRNIYNIFLIANGGAVITLVGFASNNSNIKVASLITYPAIVYFLIGAAVSTVIAIAMFFYTSLNLEQIAEDESKKINNGVGYKRNIAAYFAFYVILALILVSSSISLVFFSKGIIHVAKATAALSCVSVGSIENCRSVYGFIGHPDVELTEQIRRAIVESDNREAKETRICVVVLKKRNETVDGPYEC